MPRVINRLLFEGSSKSTFLEWLGCILTALSLSFFLANINTLIMGRNIIEPFFFLGITIILFANPIFAHICLTVVQRPRFWLCCAFILLMGLVGMITGKEWASSSECLVAIYGDVRTNLLMAFLLCLAFEREVPLATIDRVFTRIFIWITLFECVTLYLFRGQINSGDLFRFPMLAGAPFFLVVRAFLTDRPIYALASSFAVVLIAVVTIMRYNYIFVLLVVLWLACYSVRWIFVRVKPVKAFLLLAPFVLAMLYLPPVVISYYEGDINRTIHGIYRMQELFGEREGGYYDTAREYSNKVLFMEPGEFLIPQGLGGKIHAPRVQSMFGKYGVLSSLDSGIFFCFYHFGLFIGIIIVGSLFIYLIRQLISVIKTKDFSVIFANISFMIVFLSLFALKGGMFIFPQYSFYYGALLLWIARPNEFALLYSAIRTGKRPMSPPLPLSGRRGNFPQPFARRGRPPARPKIAL